MASIVPLRHRLERLKGQRESLEVSISTCKIKVRSCRQQKHWSEKALAIAQTVAQITQKELQIQISELGSSCIQTIFDEDIELVVKFIVRRDKTEADIFFLENDKERDPLYGGGFGLADVGGFALRTSLWGIQKNKIRNTLILDEPFRHLKDQSKQMQDRARQLVQSLSNELSLQFIIIDHDPSITKEADATFSMKKTKGKTVMSTKLLGEPQ